jgi:glycine/D-amino acid oxidase-like deaminating enzyme
VPASQVASEPLDADRLAAILPGRQVASDRRRMLVSFRISPDGRLLLGGPGGTGEAAGAAIFRHAARAHAQLFGHLGALRWAFGWSGRIALTADSLPHIHEPAPGLHVALGYNGRGLALSTATGKVLAGRVGGRPAGSLPLPVTAISPLWFHALARPTVHHGQRVLRSVDELERMLA